MQIKFFRKRRNLYYNKLARKARQRLFINAGSVHVLFKNLNFQKVKIDGFYKIILIKTGFRIFFKFIHRDVKPDRLAEVELVSDCFQSAEYLMGSGIVAVVANNGIFYEMVVFNNFCP